jgi:hypothetical protein
VRSLELEELSEQWRRSSSGFKVDKYRQLFEMMVKQGRVPADSTFYILVKKKLLMTKFGKSEKIGPSGSLFQIVRFWQFQSKAKEGAEFKDLKIQCVLKQEKWLKGIKWSSLDIVLIKTVMNRVI